MDGAVVAEAREGREPSGAPQSEQQLPMRSFVGQPSSGAEADDGKATHTWTRVYNGNETARFFGGGGSFDGIENLIHSFAFPVLTCPVGGYF